jgi:hypothetical protein
VCESWLTSEFRLYQGSWRFAICYQFVESIVYQFVSPAVVIVECGDDVMCRYVWLIDFRVGVVTF